MKKQPKHTVSVASQKKPQIDPHNSPDAVKYNKPVWRIGSVDFAGPWGWDNIGEATILKIIHDKIKSFESMTWAEIEGDKNHFMPVGKVSKCAKQRLREIGLDDRDTLFSFRLSGKQRIWGYREEAVLYILWWDPEHTVYPVAKKHT